LRLMRRTGVVIKLGDVMARFVPMRILPYHHHALCRHWNGATVTTSTETILALI
jgi:hypothetical protein